MTIELFDPWKDSYCTCPRKYSLNPYTGCEHACVYCYITSYIPRAFRARVKKNLLSEVKRQRAKLDPRLHISISNSSDPYTPMEKKFRCTRECLRLLKDFKVMIITKSDLVTRDIDLLREMRSCVSVTVTTLDDSIATRLEPYAPRPEHRIRALERLIEAGINAACRIDPVIPGVNSDATRLVEELSNIGVKHVVSSTYKARADSWKRFEKAFPRIAERLRRLYFDHGEKHGNAMYLPYELRLEMMKELREHCTAREITFSTCREGFNLSTARSCDGSHLIEKV